MNALIALDLTTAQSTSLDSVHLRAEQSSVSLGDNVLLYMTEDDASLQTLYALALPKSGDPVTVRVGAQASCSVAAFGDGATASGHFVLYSDSCAGVFAQAMSGGAPIALSASSFGNVRTIGGDRIVYATDGPNDGAGDLGTNVKT